MLLAKDAPALPYGRGMRGIDLNRDYLSIVHTSADPKAKNSFAGAKNMPIF
ncbi:MAG: hypothetical protein HRU19_01275 [Pseudobacteriovorax sp.]|nr:hypothetical protein [Pseudobacteriovorax sp.]